MCSVRDSLRRQATWQVRVPLCVSSVKVCYVLGRVFAFRGWRKDKPAGVIEDHTVLRSRFEDVTKAEGEMRVVERVPQPNFAVKCLVNIRIRQDPLRGAVNNWLAEEVDAHRTVTLNT